MKSSNMKMPPATRRFRVIGADMGGEEHGRKIPASITIEMQPEEVRGLVLGKEIELPAKAVLPVVARVKSLEDALREALALCPSCGGGGRELAGHFKTYSRVCQTCERPRDVLEGRR